MTQPTPRYRKEELASLLAFYAESGLDFAIELDPVDRFSLAEAPAVTERPPSVAAQSSPPRHADAPQSKAVETNAQVVSDAQAFAVAQTLATSAQSLDMLSQAIDQFDSCALKRSARHTIFEGGRRGAPLMVLLGAPQRDDDAAGQSFQGEAGRLLKAMLKAIGLDIDSEVYAGYCVPWHPPGGQPPSARHIQMYKPFLERQIVLAEPRTVLILGNTAVGAMLQAEKTIMHQRGGPQPIEIAGTPIAAFATFDPAFLLREPAQKRNAWLDLLSLRAHLHGVG